MRTFEQTHPWLRFACDLRAADPGLWMLIGEARSKCEHIAGVPLQPVTARELYRIYLSKGVHATTSIEGNTLTEAEVRRRIDGQLPLPPSREYLGREVDNVLAALTEVDRAIERGETLDLSPERIRHYNRVVLTGLEVDDHTVPGELRAHSVVVGGYRGAPAEDGPYLLERLCDWLNGPDFRSDDDLYRFALLVVKAVLAHLYLAWIHPFGDGNGRTARLVEFHILAQSGLVPLPAANLLSDHYNKTRDRYYRELERASRSGGDVVPFLRYALQGFVDGLREQIDVIREQQWRVSWEHFVHSSFVGPETATTRRRRTLVLDLPGDRAVARPDVPLVSPRVAAEYARKGDRTLTRDLNVLLAEGLIRRDGRGYRANRELILAFLPPVAQPVP